jgi:hypothetical protein
MVLQVRFGHRGRADQWYLPGTDPTLLPWPVPGTPDPLALTGGPYDPLSITAPFDTLVQASPFDPMSNRIGYLFAPTGGWNSVKNAAARSDFAIDAWFRGFVHVDLALGSTAIQVGVLSGSNVLIEGAKRGNVITGAVDDSVRIAMLSNGPGWTNDFRISTGAGNDTVVLGGLSADRLATAPYDRPENTTGAFDTSGRWTRTATDLGAGNDRFLGHGSADTVIGGPGNDVGVGRGGNDVWQLGGRSGGYSIETRGADTYIRDIDRSDGDDGSDQIRGFETIRFGDGSTLTLPDAPGIAPLALSDITAGQGGFRITGGGLDLERAWLGGTGDVNSDGRSDLLIVTRDRPPWEPNSEITVQIVFGKQDGAPVDLGQLQPDQGFAIRGTAELPIQTPRLVGDVNGDGIADLAIRSGGHVVVAFGGTGEAIDLAGIVAGTSDAGFTIPVRPDAPAFDITSAGDVNGDGLDDLLIGPVAMWRSSDIGTFFVVFGRTDNEQVDLVDLFVGASDDGFAIRGQFDTGIPFPFGVSTIAAAGDVNGDGLDDVLVSGYVRNPAGPAAYVVFGKADGATVLAGGTWITPGAGFAIAPNRQDLSLGFSAAAAGDVNGDGRDDVLLGLYQLDEPSVLGGAYVVFGKDDGGAVRLSRIADGTSEAGLRVLGAEPSGLTGRSVTVIGDQDGDGRDELLISDERGGPGIATMVFGRSEPGTIDLFGLDEQPASFGFQVLPELGGWRDATQVTAGGDINGDGIEDLIVTDSTTQGQAVYVVFGRDWLA